MCSISIADATGIVWIAEKKQNCAMTTPNNPYNPIVSACLRSNDHRPCMSRNATGTSARPPTPIPDRHNGAAAPPRLQKQPGQRT